MGRKDSGVERTVEPEHVPHLVPGSVRDAEYLRGSAEQLRRQVKGELRCLGSGPLG